MSVEQISVTQLKAWLDDKASAQPILLDVREPQEFAHCHIEGAQLMPMNTVPAQLQALDADRPTVVICHHGMRSAQVAMEVQLMNRASETSCTATPLFETVAPALKDAQRHSSFAL